jgi:hypothetical protein
MHIKSKSAISFNEFKKQINEHHDFENDWGFYIDIDNNNNNNNNKYYVLISIGISILIILII